MKASARPLRFWLVRGVPLAVAIAFVFALLPADFMAVGKVAQSQPAPAPVRAAKVLPAPAVIPPGKLQLPPPQMTEPARVEEAAIYEQAAPMPNPSTTITPIAPGAMTAPTTNVRVGYSGVNVRADAVKGSAKLFTLPPGAPVQAGETVNGWVHVQTDQGSGWVYKTYLLGSGDAQTKVVVVSPVPTTSIWHAVGKTLRVASPVAVREDPSGDGRHLYDLEAGERIQIAETSGDWARIVTADGESGWVRMH